jgi:TPR repeat protein
VVQEPIEFCNRTADVVVDSCTEFKVYPGQCLYVGTNVPQSPDDAIRCLQALAAEGNAVALYYCGAIAPTQEEAVGYYRQSADGGNCLLQYRLGVALHHGVGVARDLTEARRYLRMATEQGSASAQTAYALLLAALGDPKRTSQTISLLRTVAARNVTEAQYQLGCYLLAQDVVEAVGSFERAAAQGHPAAQYRYGHALYWGKGVREDREEAAVWFKQAADAGNADAQYAYGVCTTDLTEAAVYFKAAANQGNPLAQYSVGLYYYHGVVSQNFAKAARYFKMAADQGHVGAQFSFSVCLANGYGVPINHKDAAQYCRMAADQGDPRAQYNYAIY